MTGLFQAPWIVQALIASTLLMAIVLMLRGPVTRAFGARAAYALWLLPVLRMILPPLPGWRMLGVPVVYWQPHEKTVGIVDPDTAARLAHEILRSEHAQIAAHLAPIAPRLPVQMPVQMIVAPEPASPLSGIEWPALLLALWLGGAALWFGWQMIRYRAFLARAMRDARPLTRECGIDVLLSGHVDGPVAAGVFRRRIFLPADFMARYSPVERRLALVHEAAHHDRFDIQANLVGLAVLALHWWNPIAHRAYRAFRSDQELACDATVLADAQAGDRMAYGSAVLKSASARMPGVACALSHKAQLKQRIVMMARKPVGASRLVLGGMIAAAAIGGGLLLTASGTALAQDAHVVEFTGPPPAHVEAARIAAVQAARRAQAAGRRAEAAGRRAEAIAERASRRAEASADRISAEADRDAAIASAEATRRSARAAAEAERAAREAATAGAGADEIRRVVLATTRSNLAEQCAAAGKPVDAQADWGSLATCGRMQEMIRISMQHARQAILAAHELSDAERTRAMAEIDRSSAETERALQDAEDAPIS
jgi:beta-lactamase regulating signal transducer with metallopeptidase domain